MNEKINDPLGMTSMMNTWMKSMGELWGNAAGQWNFANGAQQTESKPDDASQSKTQAAMAAALKNWQSMAGAMATPESMTALLRGGGAMPEMLLKLAQSSAGSFMDFHQSIIQRMGRMGKSVEAYQFQDIDENLFRAWTDIYQKEFQQFFQIPQLGLMRTYQEKISKLADKYNIYQSTLSEFISLLGMPFNRSMQVMQEKLGQMAENGELTDDTKVYYNMWVKVLEGHFMTLFQTPEYVDTLSRTVNALADYSDARNAVFEDMFNQLPVATRSDMDDMARELYEVKKRLRKLEKAKK
jgi:polyhydroxyalkanoate synthesis regulator phasin